MTNLKSFNAVSYSFQGEVWKYYGTTAWHFVSLPSQLSKEIRAVFNQEEEGWGRLKCRASLSNITWDTSVWYDTKKSTYILPLKAEIRRKTDISEGDRVNVVLYI